MKDLLSPELSSTVKAKSLIDMDSKTKMQLDFHGIFMCKHVSKIYS